LTPEALPTVITFALSRGALQLVRHNVVVKRLSAIEDLGAITILCTDKTGTLTENKLSVRAEYEEKKNSVLHFMLLASKRSITKDPFDTAILEAASSELMSTRDHYTLIKEIPFNPTLRRNSVLLSLNNNRVLVTRGSFESIEKISQPIDNIDALHRWITEQSSQGNRVLAVAYKNNPTEDNPASEEGFTFVGLAAFYDPIKPTTHKALIKARKLGITIKMITGDSTEVATAVARQIELPDNHITGTEFCALSLKEKQEAVKTYTLFTRIIPQQKYEIVNLMKENNVVAFVGEGINDAPALQASHVGLAVHGASDIAKDVADIILLNNSLFAIIEGISIGRNIFSNTMKYILATISSNFGNCYSIGIASLLIDFLPLLPLQILLINFLSDLPMVAIATDTVDYDELRLPQKYDLGNLAFIAAILGITSSLFDFLTFALFYRKGPQVLQTSWFIESILTELVLVYSVRTKGLFYKAARPSLFLVGVSLLAGIVTIALPSSQIGTLMFHFKAPTAHALATIGGIVICYFITTELVKLLYYRYRGISLRKGKHSHTHYR
ncbi:HAD-IC family P-type ATPase, partial [Candidatus Dependentiae bacterium]|nr:HAD-IC family P-type ATPase [Candidatus Dependentiae bacterium]